MTDSDLLKKITEVIIEKTVNQKIPTLVFLYANKEELVDYILSSLKTGNKDINRYSSEDWKELSEIIDMLSVTPLLLKQTTDIDYIRGEAENFIAGMDGKKGLIIIHLKEIVPEQDFITDNENIAVMIIN